MGLPGMAANAAVGVAVNSGAESVKGALREDEDNPAHLLREILKELKRGNNLREEQRRRNVRPIDISRTDTSTAGQQPFTINRDIKIRGLIISASANCVVQLVINTTTVGAPIYMGANATTFVNLPLTIIGGANIEARVTAPGTAVGVSLLWEMAE